MIGDSTQVSVSVIVPAYNAATTLSRAIKSVASQSVRPLEIIVIDDGSIDETDSVARGFPGEGVTVCRLEENSGPAAARNHGLARARGDWIAVLDADDWWLPQRLETLLTHPAAREADLLCDDVQFARSGVPEPARTLLSTAETTLEHGRIVSARDSLRAHLLSFQPVFRRRFLETNGIRYDEGLSVGEDHLLLLQCLLSGGRLLCVPEPLYVYDRKFQTRSPRERAAHSRRLADVLHRLELAPAPGAMAGIFRRYIGERRAEIAIRRLVADGPAELAAIRDLVTHPIAAVRTCRRLIRNRRSEPATSIWKAL